MEFKLLEFNPRRWQRGADAARVKATDSEGHSATVWMSERDVRANIKTFGIHGELLKALGCYGSPSLEYPRRDPAELPPKLIDPSAVADQLVAQYLRIDLDTAVAQ